MIRALICAALLFTGFVAALGIASAGPPVKGNFTLERARSFQRYQLYYAGKRVAGLPLTSVDRIYHDSKYDPEVDFFSFTYGDCTPPPPTEPYGESPTCALPLEIQVKPACIRPPSYVKHPRGWKPIRGALTKYWPTGGSLQIWAGRVFIRLYPANPRITSEVVRSLVPLNRIDQQPRNRALLPAPRLDSPEKSYCRWEARRRR